MKPMTERTRKKIARIIADLVRYSLGKYRSWTTEQHIGFVKNLIHMEAIKGMSGDLQFIHRYIETDADENQLMNEMYEAVEKFIPECMKKLKR